MPSFFKARPKGPRTKLTGWTQNHLDGGPLNKSKESPDILPMPEDFWSMLQSGDKELKRRGIKHAAAEKWQIRLNRGKLPQVDATGEPRVFKDIKEFQEYVKPWIDRFVIWKERRSQERE